MKRYVTKCIVLCGCAVSLLTGCSDKELVDDQPLQQAPVALRATVASRTATRTALNDKGAFSWVAGDQISVQDESALGFATLTLNDGFFKGDITGQLGSFAFCPADLSPSLAVADSSWTVTLPDEYTRDKYLPLRETPTHAPMMGDVRNGAVSFKNLSGLMRLYVGDILKSGCRIVVTAEDGHPIAGTFTFSDKLRQITADGSTDASKAQVTYICENSWNDESTGQYFYIPLPVSASGKYRVKVYRSAYPQEGEDPYFDKTTKPFAANCQSFIQMPTIPMNNNSNALPMEASSSDGVNDGIKAALDSLSSSGATTAPPAVSLTVTNPDTAAVTVPMEKPIEIPTGITASESTSENPDEKANVKITFDQMPVASGSDETSSKAIVITDNQEAQTPDNPEAPASTESKSEVTIAIPQATEEVDPPSFDISLPTTTVTLNATYEEATYNEVTATTAENTLVVNKGVTINNLYVRSGNVTVRGIVKNLESWSARTVYVRLEGDGKVERASGNVLVMKLGEKKYDDFENEATADGMTTPFVIATIEQLMSLSNRIADGLLEQTGTRAYAECRYILKANIHKVSADMWTPIGTPEHPFKGEFNGAYNTISGAFFVDETDSYCGLFGTIDGASIQNLTLNGSFKTIPHSFTESTLYVGALCARAKNSTIVNCHNQAAVESTNTGSEVTGSWQIGGLAGNASGTTFTACTNTGSITAQNLSHIGGFVGYAENCKLQACYNTGALSMAKGTYMGGLAGVMDVSSAILGCWTDRGAVTARPEKYGELTWPESSSQPLTVESSFAVDGVPSADEIREMNQVNIPFGWEYTTSGTLKEYEGNTIPSNPVQPW